jgi:hypothetical protein
LQRVARTFRALQPNFVETLKQKNMFTEAADYFYQYNTKSKQSVYQTDLTAFTISRSETQRDRKAEAKTLSNIRLNTKNRPQDRRVEMCLRCPLYLGSCLALEAQFLAVPV